MTPAAVATAVAAGAALSFALPVRSRPRDSVRSLATGRSARWAPALLVLLALVVLPASVRGRALVLSVMGLLVLAGVLHLAARARRSARAQRRSEAVLEACAGLAADLRAGQPPQRALQQAAHEWPELAPVAAAARFDADVPDALRALASRPGADQLRAVAAAWQVSHQVGGGLAPAVSRVVASLGEARTVRRLLSAELASARATARLMAVLPFVMLLLGSGLGTDPLSFLVGTTPGLVCLGAGLALSFTGLVWLDRIADGVVR